MYTIVIFLTIFLGFASSQTIPAAIPLTVRSPYFNSWLPSTNGVSLNGKWPTFWNGRVLAWAGFVRVDGQTYQWFGRNNITTILNATTTSYHLTPTRSIFTVSAGPAQFNATFMDPIEPSDWVRHSLPFSYLFIDTLLTTDGNSHSIQFYSHSYALWVTGNADNVVQWDTTDTTSSIYHEASRLNKQPMAETGDFAEDSTAYYAMAKQSGLTWQTGFVDDLINQFATKGALADTKDTQFRPITNNNPTLGLAIDLGTTKELSNAVVWAIGVVRDPSIRTVASAGIESRSTYFWTRYQNISEAIDDFLLDFPNAYDRANALDTKIMIEASAVSPEYVKLVSLGLRQTMGSMEFTTGNAKNNASDIKVFMKDVGVSGRVNPVNTMYAALPALLYLNASMVPYLLGPLLDYQSTSAYTNTFAAPDLGTTYPTALGNNTNTILGAIENSASMLIMTFAHALKTGDATMADRYYNLLKQWADYLVTNTLHPSGYETDDDGLRYPDMSNLAVKGIIAISAMSKLAKALEKPNAEIDMYKNKAASLASEWEKLAVSTSGFVTSTYGDSSNWIMPYHLYSAKLIASDIISDTVFTNQQKYYETQIPQAGLYGLPYDSHNAQRVRSQWLMFTAGTIADKTTRDAFISMVHAHAFSNASDAPFPGMYNAQSGKTFSLSGPSSPVQGSMFALLALNLPNKFIELPLYKRARKGAIAGGVVGGVVLLVAIAALVLFWRRRRVREKAVRKKEDIMPYVGVGPSAPGGHESLQNYIGNTSFDNGEVRPFTDLPHPDVNPNAKGTIPPPPMSASTDLQTTLQGSSSKSPSRTAASGTPQPFSPSRSFLLTNSESWIGMHSRRGSTSSLNASSVAPGSSSAGQQELFVEVQQLRREMEELRARQGADEPPPMYRHLDTE
ncbi:hypothetical protein M413DRAFT_447329 [Hebeloma cylindrosporum]|uniref:DUF1793-domain-containing protein n=1 Tax=Hebeloma cylindrosporum TaxID=76867 RepID=A0A0C3C3W5_HEBCY|nr:hypothetical protein M413DRAFT_447329 [Hebeloma cylindrosporum h7]